MDNEMMELMTKMYAEMRDIKDTLTRVENKLDGSEEALAKISNKTILIEKIQIAFWDIVKGIANSEFEK